MPYCSQTYARIRTHARNHSVTPVNTPKANAPKKSNRVFTPTTTPASSVCTPVATPENTVTKASAMKPIECRNYSYNSRQVSRGVVVDISSDRQTITVEFFMKGEDNPTRITIPLTHAHNTENVFVNEAMIRTAMQYKKYLGVGIPPVRTPAVEYLMISLEELKHFIDWIFDPLNTTVLKQRGHDGERGCTHQLKDYAARTWSPYKESAKQANVSGISKKNYNMMLKLPIFKRVKSEECACNQCVVKGWEGILKLGIKLLREVDALPVWFVDAKGVRAKPSSPQGIVIHACVCVCVCAIHNSLTYTCSQALI